MGIVASCLSGKSSFTQVLHQVNQNNAANYNPAKLARDVVAVRQDSQEYLPLNAKTSNGQLSEISEPGQIELGVNQEAETLLKSPPPFIARPAILAGEVVEGEQVESRQNTGTPIAAVRMIRNNSIEEKSTAIVPHNTMQNTNIINTVSDIIESPIERGIKTIVDFYKREKEIVLKLSEIQETNNAILHELDQIKQEINECKEDLYHANNLPQQLPPSFTLTAPSHSINSTSAA